MKIVHIITRLILGGAQENTLLTCEGLHHLGHEVTLITGPSLGPEGQLLDRAKSTGYRVIEIDALRREINPIHDIPGYFKLKKLITELQPDIVHTHSAKAGILGRYAAAAVRDRAAKTCCGRVGKLLEAQQACSAKPRIVHTIHGLAFHPYQSNRKNKLYISAERAAAQKTDAFITVADAMTRQSLEQGIGLERQYTKVFSGLETDFFLKDFTPEQIHNLRQQQNIPDDAVVITTVARLFELKGHEYIIESAKQLAKKHPNAIWLFVGDGLLRDSLKRQIDQAGLTDHFRFTGLVTPEQVGHWLHASDILVHCSLREGLARALPQALLCGKPAVSFDVDGAREVVFSDKTGYLIPPKDINALSESLSKLIADKHLRQKLGQAGRDFCKTEFDHQQMVDRIIRVYKTQCPDWQ